MYIYSTISVKKPGRSTSVGKGAAPASNPVGREGGRRYHRITNSILPCLKGYKKTPATYSAAGVLRLISGAVSQSALGSEESTSGGRTDLGLVVVVLERTFLGGGSSGALHEHLRSFLTLDERHQHARVRGAARSRNQVPVSLVGTSLKQVLIRSEEHTSELQSRGHHV